MPHSTWRKECCGKPESVGWKPWPANAMPKELFDYIIVNNPEEEENGKAWDETSSDAGSVAWAPRN
jgi:hypothetical protein